MTIMKANIAGALCASLGLFSTPADGIRNRIRMLEQHAQLEQTMECLKQHRNRRTPVGAYYKQCDSLNGLITPYYVPDMPGAPTVVACVPQMCEDKLGRSSDIFTAAGGARSGAVAPCAQGGVEETCCTDRAADLCAAGQLPCQLGEVHSLGEYGELSTPAANATDAVEIADDCGIDKRGIQIDGKGTVADFENAVNKTIEAVYTPPHQCVCPHGTGAAGYDCPEDGMQKCTACNETEGYYLEPASAICHLKNCTCANGIGSAGTECPAHAQPKCDSCHAGFHSDDNTTCVKNICSCENGVPVTGADCATHMSARCATCERGYTMQMGKCVPNQCKCEDQNGMMVGNASVGPSCPAMGENHCDACADGHAMLSPGSCSLKQCQCENGNATSGSECPTDGMEFCSGANAGFHLSSAYPPLTEANECYCDNGSPAMGGLNMSSSGPMCTTHSEHNCDTCETGYRLNLTESGSYRCVELQCTCEFGLASTGTSCPEEGAEHCANCNEGYHKEGDTCALNVCECTNGQGATGGNCTEHGSMMCGECADGFTLNRGTGVCELKKCTCEHGEGATGTSCPADGHAACATCSTGFHLGDPNSADPYGCPAGSEAVPFGGQYYGVDIGGCGLTGCGARYEQKTFDECFDACAANHRCKSFTFGEPGCDKDHPDVPVCTLYDHATPNRLWPGADGQYHTVLCKMKDASSFGMTTRLPEPQDCEFYGGMPTCDSTLSGCPGFPYQEGDRKVYRCCAQGCTAGRGLLFKEQSICGRGGQIYSCSQKNGCCAADVSDDRICGVAGAKAPCLIDPRNNAAAAPAGGMTRSAPVAAQSCVANTCKCENGQAAVGMECPADGEEKCSMCNSGFALNTNTSHCDATTMCGREGWECSHDGMAMKIFTEKKMTFSEAQDFCKQQSFFFTGGDARLAQGTTKYQAEQISKMVKTSGKSVWVDAADKAIEGNMAYEQPQNTMEYTNWARGQPNNWGGKEDCLVMWKNGHWNDQKCSRSRKFVCSKATCGDASWSCVGDSVSYRVFDSKQNWADAANECAKKSASLAIIKTAAENEMVKSLIRWAWGGYWIGGTDQRHEGVWELARYASPFAKWARGEPNDWMGSEDCVAVYGRNGKWNDFGCSKKISPVCSVVDYSTLQNECKCDNGEPARGVDCPADGAPKCVSCGNGFMLEGNKCEKATICGKDGWRCAEDGTAFKLFLDDKQQWKQAREACKGTPLFYEGGNPHLAKLLLPEHAKLVKTMVREGKKNVWIASSDKWQERNFAYTGQKRPGLPYKKWGKREPNNWGGREDCTTMKGKNGKWNDLSCGAKRWFVCSRESKDPSTLSCGKNGWVCVNGKKKAFKLYKNKKSWKKAAEKCNKVKGSLARITTSYENRKVEKMIDNGGRNKAAWIGPNDRHKEGRFNLPKKQATTLRWDKGEPNNWGWGSGEDCAVLKTNGKLNDGKCTWKRGYVCEATDFTALGN
ncbi:unnamed protein product [Amoebophrya sp. A25]|nr:unnamed protein product [Amoebophrya sp. A25]|eukprot:GSA25T00007810001.1